MSSPSPSPSPSPLLGGEETRLWADRPAAVVSLARLDETPAWAESVASVAGKLGVVVESGLDVATAQARLRENGPNTLRKKRRLSRGRVAANQLSSVVIWLLVVAAAVSLVLGDVLEAVAIATAVALTFFLGFFTELRAVRSMEALRRLGTHESRIRRDGVMRSIEASQLVTGDIVVLESGDRVSADVRLALVSQLQSDESALTGESIPVSKQVEAITASAPLAERSNMLFKGTNVARGAGVGIVVGTGMQTELGRIASLVEATANEETPLEKQLGSLGRTLLWTCLGVAVATGVVGVLGGRDLGLMLTTAIALAVAAIPEGLPIVATIALARGMWRLAARHALIKNLSAVETLGATNVILVDKTGTLTENKLTATAFVVYPRLIEPIDAPAALFEIANLCNNASLNGDESTGDPLEVALLRSARDAGHSLGEHQGRWPRVREVAFDPAAKMMATVHQDGAHYRVAVKGAAEAVAEVCTTLWKDGHLVPLTPELRSELSELENVLAREGLRVLALAERRGDAADIDVYEGLGLVGLIGFADPPRPDVAAPLAACRAAGIRVVMATGDQAVTASTIAKAVGLTSGEPTVAIGAVIATELASGELSADLLAIDVFARVAPEQKLSIVELFQRHGNVVAMTGDGVNDAPALRRAEIGVAMGKRGTDVAREAADMVLIDDSFESIVVAIEQGRAIFENIRRFVIYLLSCNLSEILVVAGAIVLGAPLPLLPLQILFLNLVTDVFPALALGFGKASPNAMSRPPRDSREPIVSARHWAVIAAFALLITGATLGAQAIAIAVGLNPSQVITVAFLTLGFAQLWHVFNLRDAESSVLRNEVVRNPWVWGATALCVSLLVAATVFSGLARVLGVTSIGLEGWAIVLGSSLAPLAIGQLYFTLRWLFKKRTVKFEQSISNDQIQNGQIRNGR